MLDALFMGYLARQNIVAKRAGITAERAAEKATQARSQLELMRMDIDRLFMISEALWTLLRDEHGYTDDQLIQKVKEIDMGDGHLNGKPAKQPPSTCSQCGRAMSARRTTCVFCGTENAGDPFQR
jgi:hypothetical protein